MAGEWEETSLAAIMDVKHGFAFSGEKIRDEPPGDILLTPGNFAIGGGFKGDKFKYFDGEVPVDYVLSEGDLVVTMTDLSKQADTLGYPALVPKPCGLRFLHNQRLGKVLIKNGADLDKGFLFYLLRTAEYRHEVLASATGTTVKHTSPARILAHKASIPPLAEQKAIAAVLGALDDKIELNRRMNAKLEEMARALFQSWFVDFDPVRAKLDGRQPVGLDPATAALFPDSFQDSEAGNIPKGWEVAKLKELTSKIGSGATPRGGSEVYVDEGPALIRSQNVYDYEFRWSGLARLTDKSAEELKNVEVMKNDVLLNITGDSILRTCVVDPAALPARVNQHVAIIRAINDIPAHYLHLCLVQESMKSFLIGMSAGATRHAITKGHLESIDVLKPSTLVLKAFEQRTTPWFAQIDGNRSQSRTLATLRDMLLPKLLSGELQLNQN
jgi:type I restriction enzyme S subunit